MIKLLVLILLLSATTVMAETVDRIAAVVGDEIILQSDIKAYANRQAHNRLVDNTQLTATRRAKTPLEEIIREKLLQHEIKRLDVQISDQDLSGGIGNILQRNQMTLDALKQELAHKGIAFETYKQQMSEQIKQMKFISQVIYPRIQITDGEVNKQLHAGASDTERLRAKQALIESRISDELDKYLEDVRAKTYIELKN